MVEITTLERALIEKGGKKWLDSIINNAFEDACKEADRNNLEKEGLEFKKLVMKYRELSIEYAHTIFITEDYPIKTQTHES